MQTDHNSEFGYGYYLSPLLRRVFFTICSSIVLCTGALASPGDSDPTFGAGGRVLTQFGTSQDEGRAIAIQPDGKIVVAGFMDPGFGLYDFAIARYNPDGTLDTSFGGGGKVTVNFGFQTNGNPTVDIANAGLGQSTTRIRHVRSVLPARPASQDSSIFPHFLNASVICMCEVPRAIRNFRHKSPHTKTKSRYFVAARK